MTGTDLKVARVREHVKLKDVAHEMGISSSRLSRIEYPESRPVPETIARYLSALDKCRTSRMSELQGSLMTRREPCYLITLYRDTAEDAAVERQQVGSEDDLATALTEARRAAADRVAHDPRWSLWSATVDGAIRVRRPVRLGNMTVQSVTYEDATPFRRWSLGPTWTDGPETDR